MNINPTNQSKAAIKTAVSKGGARAGSGRKPKGGTRTSVYPSGEVTDLWKGLALKKKILRIAVLEDAIRSAARAEGLTLEAARALIEQDEQTKKNE